ncbi:DUF551 domain-containing protein [Cupriavidus sp. 2KB_3]|uniref:DUF551 domain-containing protein n=1 Tax=Cupriavidus sp. 2KB_3 TaxID=3232980 RepID=UPI003F92398E
MAEKLDLDALERALIGSAMGLTFRKCQTLIKYARALESRASNAGGAVAEPVTDWNAWITDASRDEYIEAFLDTLAKAADRETERYMTRWFMGGWPMWVNAHPKRGLEPVGMPVGYTPAPASKEPVADERAMVRGVPKSIINAITAYGDARADSKDTGEAIGNAVSAIRAALATAQTSCWTSVEDELPIAERDYLVRGIRNSGLYHDIAGLFHGKWMSQVTQDDCKFNVTHWMPLPAAPAKPEGV